MTRCTYLYVTGRRKREPLQEFIRRNDIVADGSGETYENERKEFCGEDAVFSHLFEPNFVPSTFAVDSPYAFKGRVHVTGCILYYLYILYANTRTHMLSSNHKSGTLRRWSHKEKRTRNTIV